MQLDDTQYNQLNREYLKLGQDALRMNHYQLAEETSIKDAVLWKHFLMDPKTVDYVQAEMNIIRNAEINNIIQHASDDKRSVGQAQIINALAGIEKQYNKKEGPTFIYCYVPLNKEQAQAPNVLEYKEEKPKRKKAQKIEFKNLSKK